MKKSLTTAAAMLAIFAAGTQVHADQINGEQVTPVDANHATGSNGDTWTNDGGEWYDQTTGEHGILSPDPLPILTPEPQPQPEPPTPTIVEPEAVPEAIPTPLPTQKTPTIVEPVATPEAIPTPLPEPDATDPTDEPEDVGHSKATITITEPKTADVTGAHKSAPADIEKLAIKDIEKAQNDAKAKPQAATATPKAEAVPTTLGTVTKSIDTATPAPVYQAKGTPLPATGENDTTAETLAGIGSIAGAAALAIYLQRKGA